MNLIVDIGNSSAKFAFYENGKKKSVTRITDLLPSEVENLLSKSIFEKAIISSVKPVPPFLPELLNGKAGFLHILSYGSGFPFTIDYQTPETLGPDRIAGIAGAFRLFPDSPLMVIDAGTAITYDFLTDGVYKGGNISPGLSMRFRALNKFTGKLPLVSLSENFTSPGQNTRDAILAGVITGALYEINEYIRTFEKKVRELKIFLTGGDGEFINGKIDQHAIYVPDLVIDGLNFILEYNAA
jgi:type III pantothenate kinase